MKPAPFAYEAPETVEAALSMLADDPEAEPMAGNQSLGIVMANRLATPARIIDLNGIDELESVRPGDETIEIGAMARHRTIERHEAIRSRLPGLAEAAAAIAGPSVRNRGTIGGSLAEADPAANLPVALLALDATVEVRSVENSRQIPIDELLLGPMVTDLDEDELITAVTVPTDEYPDDRSAMAYLAAKRAGHSWPIVTAMAAVRVADPTVPDPAIDRVAVAIGNATPVPTRLSGVESTLVGESVSAVPEIDIAGRTRAAADPPVGSHGDAEHRASVAGVYARRALETAIGRVQREEDGIGEPRR